MYKRKIFIITAILALSLTNHNVQAKSITFEELQRYQANYIPAVDISAKEFDNRHWAYKSLENITRKYGLLIGDAGDEFDGTRPLTRNEAAVILVNLVGKVEQSRIELNESEKTQLEILKNELSKEITTLTGRVAALEDSVNKLQGSISKAEDNNKKTFKYGYGEDFKLSGSFQFKYAGNIQKGADDYLPNFSLPYSEFRVSGKVAPHLNYVTSMLPYKTWGGSNSSTTAGGLLGDAYVSTDIFPHHTAYFGQSRIPVGVEGQLSTATLDTVDRSQISRNFSNYRDMGVKVAGTWPLFDYIIGAFNGAGENYKDITNNMGIGGWLTAKPLYQHPEWGKLELGSGYYRQQNGNATNTALSTRYESQTFGAALGYKYKKFGLKGECAAKHGYGATTSRGAIPVAKGFFVQSTYDLTPELQLLARYDIFDPSQLVKRNNNIEYTGGINYFFKNNIKLQVNGVFVGNQAGKNSKRLLAVSQYLF